MSLVSWLAFGLIVGIVANTVDPAPNKGGMLGSIVLGIIGALVGGFVANLIFGITISGFNVTSFLVAVAGSLLLLVVGKTFQRA